MKRFFKTALGLTALAATAVTQAATTTTTMAVTATVPISCTVSANTLAFGTVTAIGQMASSSISVNCANGIPYKVALDAGQNVITSNGTPFRRMKSGTGISVLYMAYDLFKPSPLQGNEWGDSDLANTYTAGSSQAGTGSGAAQSLTFSGRISQAQNNPGTYSDTVTVTVNF